MLDPVLTGVAAGVLVQVFASTGRRIATEFRGVRKRNKDVDVATWFDTYALSDSLPTLPSLPAGIDEAQLEQVLRGDDVQAIVQELLAVRLCDAPEAEAGRLREGFQGLLGARLPEASPLAGDLFDFFDEAICDLTVRLSSERPEVLRTIREEAQLTRINATLAAVERHTASFARRGFPQADQGFLVRYRRQIADYHGKIEPPDLERRRRVAINDLFVSPTVVRVRDSGPPFETDLDGLDDEIDRTVLLGEPGGGKTTASHVLTYQYAADPNRSIPFFVTLREFAADDPPARSVVGYIEHRLETFYQCQAPAGLVERLLLDGAALVIFDGLDELIDTGRRGEVSAVVERFCMEYPLSRVLVTSRLIGYDEARLDDTQFVRYRIAGFDDERVGEYVRKWFAQDSEFTPEEAARYAEEFMLESSSAEDLRSNPLMLALMCILYRGEGSIPRNRPEVYEQCSTLLFRRWDARRRIHVDLRARNLVEPALRYLAYWLFTRAASEPAVTERELVAKTAQYLQERGFEEAHDAEVAAQEFVEFCRGRAWVFSDAGTTARGEKLYTFTHRTFLEYFAAVQLASMCDTPEQLARKLAPRIAREEWEVVAQVALQVKDRTADRGADRVYAALLAERRRRSDDARENILSFLASCLAFLSISPPLARDLARQATNVAFRPTRGEGKRYTPLALLVGNCRDQTQTIGSELDTVLAEYIEAPDVETRLTALRIAVYLDDLPVIAHASLWRRSGYWEDLAEINRRRYARKVAEVSERDAGFAVYLIGRREMEVDRFLSMHGPEVEVLFRHIPIFDNYKGSSYVNNRVARLILGVRWGSSSENVKTDWIRRQLDVIADILMGQKEVPSLDGDTAGGRSSGESLYGQDFRAIGRLSERQRVAAGFLICIFAELSDELDIDGNSPYAEFVPYVEARSGHAVVVPPLDFPARYRDLFTAWSHKEINFVSWKRDQER